MAVIDSGQEGVLNGGGSCEEWWSGMYYVSGSNTVVLSHNTPYPPPHTHTPHTHNQHQYACLVQPRQLSYCCFCSGYWFLIYLVVFFCVLRSIYYLFFLSVYQFVSCMHTNCFCDSGKGITVRFEQNEDKRTKSAGSVAAVAHLFTNVFVQPS
jgi:hypothetical protein